MTDEFRLADGSNLTELPQGKYSKICDPAVTRRLDGARKNADIEYKNWSGARDLNPGPHGPEL